MFDCVLVANRGEIACRVIRTLRSLGIRSAAVYSDADAGARHVGEADVAYRLGPSAPAQSYLDIERILTAAVAMGADALHPGYGFLSENVALAAACAARGIAFVGPPVAAIEAMGDKIRAKATVAAHGVQTVPGVSGVGLDDRELIELAAPIGFPMLIKPSAGGGGKGMHLVGAVDDLPDAIAASRREARSAFGDDTLLIERFVPNPRHIEVQVLADAHGNVVHLGERECSLQRRHQKIVEEAPSPFLSPDQREGIGAQAVAAARACGYVNAGTVEFIVSGDQPDEPFFMEMNTRLQVEHPVTEAVWGLDLVELQLRIAAGERLPFSQEDLRPSGWSMEARVYAEDPAHDFLPTGGTVRHLVEPSQLPGIRIDSSLKVGGEVVSTYDPMLSKVIAWGADRDTARRRLRAALRQTSVLGVTTNVAFLCDLLDDPDVIAGRLDTALVGRFTRGWDGADVPDVVPVAAALLTIERSSAAAGRSVWGDAVAWCAGPGGWTSWEGAIDGAAVSLRFRIGHDQVEVKIGERITTARLTVEGATAFVELDGVTRPLVYAGDGQRLHLGLDGRSWAVDVGYEADRSRSAAGSSDGALTSPMPGTVVAVHVEVGDEVVAGQPIVVVEAMKMEHTLVAPHDGHVTAVNVGAGDQVELHAHLATVEPRSPEGDPVKDEGSER